MALTLDNDSLRERSADLQAELGTLKGAHHALELKFESEMVLTSAFSSG